MPFAALTALAALMLPLTATQYRRLQHVLACPESLPDDPARIRNSERFDRLIIGFAPASRSGQRAALRRQMLDRKGCDPHADHLQHTTPEL